MKASTTACVLLVLLALVQAFNAREMTDGTLRRLCMFGSLRQHVTVYACVTADTTALHPGSTQRQLLQAASAASAASAANTAAAAAAAAANNAASAGAASSSGMQMCRVRVSK